MSFSFNSDPAFAVDEQWLLKICRGNESAKDFLMMFFLMCHVWDDLIDKDVQRSDAHINHAFWIALVEIPRNKYYRSFRAEIEPIIAVAIQEWFASNALEHPPIESDQRLDIAYTLRCSIVSLIHQAAEICGGYEWALQVGEEIRRYTQNETLEVYVEDINA